MSKNKFESELLKEVNTMNEGIALRLFKWFARPAVRKMLEKAAEDPEVIAAVDGYNKQAKVLASAIKKYKGKNPNRKLPWED